MRWLLPGVAALGFCWLAWSGIALGEEILVAIQINGQSVSDGDLVDRQGAILSVPRDLALRLRLRLPAGGGDRIALNDLPGVRVRLDPVSQTLYLDVDPAALERTEIGGFLTKRPYDRTTETGLFGNYTLLLESGAGSTLATGLFDLGLFSPWGSGTSDVTASNVNGLVRLQSHFGRDLDGGDMLTIGDGFLFPGALGQSFPFAGLSYVSRTAATGGQATTPVQSILGQAALPSTVDVYVNNALQSRQSIDAGPFALQDLPTVTGQGEVRVVVRDVLGREQVITRSFYGSTRLLAPDAEEYGYQLGVLRQNYGLTSFDYAEPFASATWRRGLTPIFTTELHGEGSTKRDMVGGQASLGLGDIGVGHLGAAASRAYGRNGEQLTAGIDSQFGPLGVGFSTDLAGGRFTELGYSGDRSQREASTVRTMLDLGASGSIDLSLVRFRIEHQSPSSTIAAGYSLSIANRFFLEASLSDNLSQHDMGGLLTLGISFDGGTTASASTTRSGGKFQSAIQANQPISGADGVGYDGTIQRGISDRAEAGATYRSPSTELTAHVGTYNGSGVARVTASGALEAMDGHVYASRQTSGGFAVVDVGEPGIRVTLDNQDAGVSDAEGHAFIPRLRPGEINRIAINPEDVPLDVALPETEQEIVPQTATGYKIEFAVHHQHPAMATLVGPDHQNLPAGLKVRLDRTGATATMGSDGVLFLNDVAEGDILEAEPAGGTCKAEIHLPAIPSAQYPLGVLICR